MYYVEIVLQGDPPFIERRLGPHPSKELAERVATPIREKFKKTGEDAHFEVKIVEDSR